MKYLQTKNVGKLLRLPNGRNAVPIRWTYDMKPDLIGAISRFKARFVGKVFMQIQGVHFFEVFSPVFKYSSVQMVLALMSAHCWKRMCLNTDTALLNAPIDQELYFQQAE